MKFAQIILSALMAGASLNVSAQNDNSISFGVGVNPLGVISTFEFQHAFGNSFSLGIRQIGLSYNYVDSSYQEKGVGSGAEFRAQYFFDHEGIKGSYLAVGTGNLSFSWDWIRPYSSGSGTSSGQLTTLSFGNVIPLGKNGFFDPYLTLGGVAMQESNPKTNLAGVAVVIAGVNLGLVF